MQTSRASHWGDASRVPSAPTRVEAGIVALWRGCRAGLEQMDALFETVKLETAPLSADHARLAIDVFLKFANGRRLWNSVHGLAGDLGDDLE